MPSSAGKSCYCRSVVYSPTLVLVLMSLCSYAAGGTLAGMTHGPTSPDRESTSPDREFTSPD
eukprot:641335-Pyramimonas_sp.AAC.1